MTSWIRTLSVSVATLAFYCAQEGSKQIAVVPFAGHSIGHLQSPEVPSTSPFVFNFYRRWRSPANRVMQCGSPWPGIPSMCVSKQQTGSFVEIVFRCTPGWSHPRYRNNLRPSALFSRLAALLPRIHNTRHTRLSGPDNPGTYAWD
ncbi:hypothetical protein C8R46DRAFT_1124563 [Mycena filopes]|nr:hypothetical protein C8R46DRAFT_1124563 [Mycena filopes]